jgi:hypothetical protein
MKFLGKNPRLSCSKYLLGYTIHITVNYVHFIYFCAHFKIRVSLSSTSYTVISSYWRLGTANTLPNLLFVLFCLLFVLFCCQLWCSTYCLCVNVYCYRVSTQLQLTNISYHISYHSPGPNYVRFCIVMLAVRSFIFHFIAVRQLRYCYRNHKNLYSYDQRFLTRWPSYGTAVCCVTVQT